MRFWLIRLASVLLAVGACLLLGVVVGGASSIVQRLVVLAGLYVILAVSLNLINGITGQFSLGHAAFYQVGAYTAGFLAMRFYERANLPPLVWMLAMILAGGFMAALAGFIVGLPSLRLRGDYLAIVTLGFGEIIRIVAQNQQALGGSYGMNVSPRLQFTWLVWLLAIACIAACRNLLKVAHGLPFLSVRENEVASLAMGVNVTRTKVTAFIIGSAFAGAAGALLAHFEGFISPPMFAMDLSFIILTMVVLGGSGSITGSTLAAVVLFYIPEKLRDLGTVGLPSLIASAIMLALTVAALRAVRDRYHGPLWPKALRMAGVVAAGLVLTFVLAAVFGAIPALAARSVEGAKLRMVVFSLTLVILMLLRPQGIFAHHEFSLSWLGRLFGRKSEPHKAISA